MNPVRDNKKALFSILLQAFVLSGYALALTVSGQLREFGPSISYTGLIANIETAIWVVFGAIAVISFVYSGIIFLSSKGEPEAIKTAKAALVWGVVGVVVGIVAYSVIAIVGTALGL